MLDAEDKTALAGGLVSYGRIKWDARSARALKLVCLSMGVELDMKNIPLAVHKAVNSDLDLYQEFLDMVEYRRLQMAAVCRGNGAMQFDTSVLKGDLLRYDELMFNIRRGVGTVGGDWHRYYQSVVMDELDLDQIEKDKVTR